MRRLVIACMMVSGICAAAPPAFAQSQPLPSPSPVPPPAPPTPTPSGAGVCRNANSGPNCGGATAPKSDCSAQQAAVDALMQQARDLYKAVYANKANLNNAESALNQCKQK